MSSFYSMKRMKFVPVAMDTEIAELMFTDMFEECEPFFNKPCIYKSDGFHPVIETTDGKAYIISYKEFSEFFNSLDFVPLSTKQIRAFDTVKQYLTKEQKALVVKSKEMQDLKYVELRMKKFFKQQGAAQKVKKLPLP